MPLIDLPPVQKLSRKKPWLSIPNSPKFNHQIKNLAKIFRYTVGPHTLNLSRGDFDSQVSFRNYPEQRVHQIINLKASPKFAILWQMALMLKDNSAP